MKGARQPFRFTTDLGQLGHKHVRAQMLIISAVSRYMTLFLHSIAKS